MVLERILQNKYSEVAERKKLRPLSAFRDSLSLACRSLKTALKKQHTSFILECKKASPSKGLIRENFDIISIASTYKKFADAISVLADEKFFQGSLDYVRQVSELVDVPVLCKDFTIDPYQVYEARYFGADAVLLMLSVLDDETYIQCARACRELNMSALTEVHDEAELQRALKLDADIIGINNRSFKNLTTDLNVSRRLLPLVPKDRVSVVESGLSSHREIVSFRNDCDGFLVGSNLMSEPDLESACKKLVFGPAKVCGLTREEDACTAYETGAVFGGLIFAEKSPRFVSEKQALLVRNAAPLKWVGVFVNAPLEQVVKYAQTFSLSAVQLHGDETCSYIESLRKLLPESIKIWKSISVGDEKPMINDIGADLVLLDTASKTIRGGTGKSFNWELIKDINLKNVILSGGLSPFNALEADLLGACLLDVNSGVEESPGKKNKEKLEMFFRALRG